MTFAGALDRLTNAESQFTAATRCRSARSGRSEDADMAAKSAMPGSIASMRRTVKARRKGAD